MHSFVQSGKASFIIGGQWGSEGKGAAAAWVAKETMRRGHPFDIVTTNAGAQAGHTSLHDGRKRVVFHLPTYSLVAHDCGARNIVTYLNAGSIIDPVVLLREIEEHHNKLPWFFIHPNAAVITDGCRAAEGRNNSAQTQIASTRKGVGEALARKVLRSGMIAADHPDLKPFVRPPDYFDLQSNLLAGRRVLVEVPQGFSLGLNGRFYPHVTSRECSVQQAMSDARIHPHQYGQTMMVIRTFPIRVGNIIEQGQTLGESGPYYADQRETSWEELGVEAEITTVTKRVRRVFTFSKHQIIETMRTTRPDVIYLTFCDYLKAKDALVEIHNMLHTAAIHAKLGYMPYLVYQSGPSTDDVSEAML